jgi:hypothetical protein
LEPITGMVQTLQQEALQFLKMVVIALSILGFKYHSSYSSSSAPIFSSITTLSTTVSFSFPLLCKMVYSFSQQLTICDDISATEPSFKMVYPMTW